MTERSVQVRYFPDSPGLRAIDLSGVLQCVAGLL
jgi:hypothetical protein